MDQYVREPMKLAIPETFEFEGEDYEFQPQGDFGAVDSYWLSWMFAVVVSTNNWPPLDVNSFMAEHDLLRHFKVEKPK